MNSRSGYPNNPSFNDVNFKQPYKRILIVKSNGVSDIRMDQAYYGLIHAGFDVEMANIVPMPWASEYDLFIISRPSNTMVDFVQLLQRAGKRYIIDMDDDFTSIPKTNPAYNALGAGNPQYITNLQKILEKADRVTFASKELNNRYHMPGVIIRNCIDEANPAWVAARLGKSKSTHIRLGFTGTNTHREDFKMILPALKSILGQYPYVKIIIGNDGYLLNYLNDVPESQKGFIPPLAYDDYPNTYKVVDILLAPLEFNHFNCAKSTIKLIEATATGTPYIASCLPMYSEFTYAVQLETMSSIRTAELDPEYSKIDRPIAPPDRLEEKIQTHYFGQSIPDDGWYNAIESAIKAFPYKPPVYVSNEFFRENCGSDMVQDIWAAMVTDLLSKS